MSILDTMAAVKRIQTAPGGVLTQRVVVIHSGGPDLFDESTAAHAFGPFDSIEEAEAFNAAGSSEDQCYKATIVIVGPREDDIIAAEQEEARHVATHMPTH